MLTRRIMTFTSLGTLAFFGLYYAIAPHYLPSKTATINATLLKPNKPLTNFKLSSTDGKEFNLNNLRGHWTLMFFGYMGCPDICPKTLALLADTWHIFENKKSYPTKFVFASIDNNVPSQDSLQSFLNNYNEKFSGIYGAQANMHELTTQLGVYAQRQGQIIDHSSALILIDPQARIKALITPPFDAANLATDLEILTK
jgi:protein SCO1/2